MYLNEFAIRVIDALLEKRGLCRAGAYHRIRGASKNRADAARTENYRVRGKGFHFHGAQIHRANAPADPSVIDNRGQKRPAFVLGDFVFRFMPANLLVQGVEELLARGGSSKGGAM